MSGQVIVTDQMRQARDALVEVGGLYEGMMPTEVVAAVVNMYDQLTATMGLSKEQQGWTLMAFANLLAGVGCMAVKAGESGGGVDEEVTEAIGAFTRMMATALGVAGNRLVVDSELPTWED